MSVVNERMNLKIVYLYHFFRGKVFVEKVFVHKLDRR